MDMSATHGIIDTIQENPKTGAMVTGAAFAGSHIVKFIDGGHHIDPWIIELFQIGGYATTILVGLFTVIGYAKKFREKKPKNP